MRVIFDLDDTICVHKKRDFENALPVAETIEKIRLLKKAGVHIVIYTARGQNSCCGNVELIKTKYQDSITDWLNKNGVPFDELIFGKPLGDLYIDDKGMSLQEFYQMDFEKMSGKSGSEVYRCGNIVNKKCNNSWEQSEWFEYAATQGINVPRVYSVVLDNIEMEYIDGKITEMNIPILNKMMSIIFLFQQIKDESVFDVDKLIERVDEHLAAVGCLYSFDKLKTFLRLEKEYFAQSASFSHGDFSISNCLVKDNNVYLIDPNQNKQYSSYLLDFAKLKFSLNGGEKYINNCDLKCDGNISEVFKNVLIKNNLYQVVTALEITHWLRLLKYEKNQNNIENIIQKAKAMEAEL